MVNRVFDPPAAVATIDDEATEQELVSTAKAALSNCNWTVGECAAKWTRKYSRGRADADFGQLVGLSGEQVYQRRRVWEDFSNTYSDFPALKWSHFYVSLTWQDRDECLAWANENEATIAEMKAWRRMQNGEDLTVDSDSSAADELHDADEYAETSDSIESIEGATAGLSGSAPPLTAPDHDPAENEYTPFRKDAGSPPRDQTRLADEKPARGKSGIALVKAHWRSGRELIHSLGPATAQALLTEMLSDHKLTGEVEEVDEARLRSLLKAIRN